MVDVEIAFNRSAVLRCLDQLEPFSPVLRRLLATLADGDDSISVAEIGNLIEKDTLIAGQVLGAANSALYNRGSEIVSVRRAVARLGVGVTRNLLLALSVNRIWSSVRTPASWSMLRFNAHSLATAITADLLSSRLPTEYPEGAFVAGLFHDIGHLLIATMLDEQYDRLFEVLEKTPNLRCEVERELLGYDHADLSSDAIAHWNLPLQVQRAVGFHERPQLDESPLTKGRLRLSQIVCAADRYVDSHGISLWDGDRDHDSNPLEIVGANEEEANIYPELKAQFDMVQASLRMR